MDQPRVLLIESTRANGKSFASALKKRYRMTLAYSGKQGIAVAQDVRPEVIVLDAVSMRTTGDRICRTLRAHLPETPIIHIRPPAQDTDDVSSPADVLLYHPFTWRKLVNRIKRFVSRETDPEEILQAGNLRLDVPRRVLTVGDRNQRLTPKLAGLAEIFLRSPNTVIPRETFIKRVWDTTYMGDTRTLDVHIRWLREVVEEDPSRPRVITTVRGVGYLLTPPR